MRSEVLCIQCRELILSQSSSVADEVLRKLPLGKYQTLFHFKEVVAFQVN